MNISQGDKTVSEYFLKVNNLCREIEQLDVNAKIGEDRMRWIILNGMRPEYSAFITTIQGWTTQPTLLELENLLVSQEALAKQLVGLTVKHKEEKALYSGRHRESSRDQYRQQPETEKVCHEKCKRCSCSGGASTGQEAKGAESGKYRSRRVECYNCGRQGNYARECQFRKNEGSFMVTTEEKAPEEVPSEEEWDAMATVAM